MDLKNLQDLELYFADHFDTVLFPMLAEHYLTEGDFSRAHQVLEIGLSHHTKFIPGLFIEARTFLAEGDLKAAEKLLKQIITLDPSHYNAYVLLAEVQVGLGRAARTVTTTYQKILQMDGTNEKANGWLEKSPEEKREALKKSAREKRAPKIAGEKISEGTKRVTRLSQEVRSWDTLSDFPLTPKVATFTLMAVLKSQKLYRQAMEVLVVMSQKEGADIERIEKEKEELMEHLKMEEWKH